MHWDVKVVVDYFLESILHDIHDYGPYVFMTNGYNVLSVYRLDFLMNSFIKFVSSSALIG